MNIAPVFRYLLTTLLLWSPGAMAQHGLLRDSLRRMIAVTRSDTVRIQALSRLTEECLDTSYSLAMYYAATADSLADKIHWLPGKILAQTAIGYSYQGVELPDSALRYFHTAYTLALREPDKTYLKKCAFALSRFYTDGNPDSSLHYKTELLRYARLLQATSLEIYTLNELGELYSRQRAYRQAIGWWQQATALLRRTQRRNHEAIILVSIGYAHLDLHDFDSARNCFFTALSLADGTADLHAKAAARIALADYYRKVSRADSAQIFSAAALPLASNGGDKEQLRDVWKQLADIYEQAGKPAPALNAYKQYILYRDSVTHEERNAADAKKILQATYAQQLAGMDRQQEALRATARRQRYQLLGVGSGLLLVGLLAIVCYYALVQNRKRARTIAAQAALLRAQKQSIEASLTEKEMLMKEIHHRVKNNLQVISALQQMQASRTTDPDVKAALGDSQNRVLSIAFIHHNLYQHDDLRGVEMASFMQELSEHIGAVFARPGVTITTSLDIMPVTLDIDSAVPLGLLLNELLTNSYKYAFRDRTDGHIRISLQPEAADGHYLLVYSDDGPGLPAGLGINSSKTLGMKLIRQLSRQLGGAMQYSAAGGSTFTLSFMNLEARNELT